VKLVVLLLGAPGHFAAWEGATDEQREEFFERLQEFSAAVAERGSVVAGEGLDHPQSARTLNAGADRIVTDGPYAEFTEQLGGFYVVDLPDLDTAIELARLLPDRVPGTDSTIAIEVRPAVEG
jgi:hypothetical protein